MGTDVIGTGETVRQSSLRTSAGTVIGTTVAWPRTAIEIAFANVGADGLDGSGSEEAQQLSASACVKTRAEPG